ncbi:hypothetical protein [Pedobacter miscanthi]|uniref:Uncharacterized protein n=1 Tax=Pedobacter miscanthi TaxID=2259170 RepID=A0A366LCU2_9SPHI|nr:hypothetical protein [Pedobacter miscanthi]RBQ11705.1 hypothetical protein DRW42_00025 [Pedobacter miscanthi]
MKFLFLFISLIFLHFNSFSQKKKARAEPPPPPKESLIAFSEKPFTLQPYAFPILFEWEINADTTLKAGTVFKKVIKLTYEKTEVNGYYSQQAVTFKKFGTGLGIPEREIPKLITKVDYYDVEILNDVIIFKERDRKVIALKIIYNKNNLVSRLKDVNDGTVYRRVKSEEHPIEAP